MSQSSALTPEQQADVAKQRKSGILGVAIISAFLLILYFFIAQFVGFAGFIILALILTLFWWSVLRKNAYTPKASTASLSMQTAKPETTKKEHAHEPIHETHATVQKELREAPTYDDL